MHREHVEQNDDDQRSKDITALEKRLVGVDDHLQEMERKQIHQIEHLQVLSTRVESRMAADIKSAIATATELRALMIADEVVGVVAVAVGAVDNIECVAPTGLI